MIALSVIIPTFNRVLYLKKAVKSILGQSIDKNRYEMIVIDNGSTDGTQVVIDELNEINNGYIRYFYESQPGLHVGRHKGAKEARGDILVFCDDDIVADKYWLEGIIETFENTEAVLVGGKILPKYEINPPEWIERFWTFGEEGKHLDILSLIDMGDKIKEVDPSYILGCNYSIKKEIFFECGGFNPDSVPDNMIKYRGDGETGLSLKIKEKGWKAYYNPKACVYHNIPKERLTVKYFCKRMFNQGISDSFTEMRKLGGVKDPIRMRVRDAYKKGKIFHREEVLRDKRLLDWVLKESYL